MDWYIIIAGIIAAMTTIGHFVVGSKEFLRPMLEASFDQVSKKVMHCVFHYVSTFLILSSVTLLLIGSGILSGAGTEAVINFIGLNYVIFAIWQIVIAITSGIQNGIFKLFQWIFFVLIALFSFMGTLL